MYKSNKPIKKKENLGNIKDFTENKKLYSLTKVRSPLSIVFIEDKEDPWFIYVKYYKTKSGEITDSSMIIRADIDDWLKAIKNSGYEEVKK
jgi:hypothetical protein